MDVATGIADSPSREYYPVNVTPCRAKLMQGQTGAGPNHWHLPLGRTDSFQITEFDLVGSFAII